MCQGPRLHFTVIVLADKNSFFCNIVFKKSWLYECNQIGRLLIQLLKERDVCSFINFYFPLYIFGCIDANVVNQHVVSIKLEVIFQVNSTCLSKGLEDYVFIFKAILT